MKMEGSPDTSWRNSENSRGLDASASSDKTSRLLKASRMTSPADASKDSGLKSGRKARDSSWKSPSDHPTDQDLASGVFEDELAPDHFASGTRWADVSLRVWLDDPERAVDSMECLHIFTQIVEIVSAAHSQGIVVNNVRPSCFLMSSFNHVLFIESASCSDSDSDSLEDGVNDQKGGTSEPCDLNKLGETNHLQSVSCPRTDLNSSRLTEECETRDCGNSLKADEKNNRFPMKNRLQMESNWYTSPEEIAGGPSSCASDIYRLGVLLFELFCTFSSPEEKSRTMSSLRHRVLPPQLLLKYPKEASFCLWLLHPDPSSRPKMGELLESEFLNEPRGNIEERQAAIELRKKIEEQELLLEFLLLIRKNKQEAADKLHDTISLVSSDIGEIENMHKALKKKGASSSGQFELRHSTMDLPLLNDGEQEESSGSGRRKRVRPEQQKRNSSKYSGGDPLGDPQEDHMLEKYIENHGSLLLKNSRLMKNFKKLELAYLSTRRRPTRPPAKQNAGSLSSNSRGSAILTERSGNNSLSKDGHSKDGESGWVSPFLEGLFKYLSFTKLRVKAEVKQGDILNSSNLVCSVSFDRDGDFFAAAGVNKKIKVFECDGILNEDRDIHYPVVELNCRSKLSSVCWNSYIKSQIASSNFEGVVQVWDVTRSQVFMELKEHKKRVWSVDFSLVDPTILASGSDDGCVKLWNINQGTSIGTIRTKANVCCVQFPSDSGRSLAFGSADHRVYYYDLRNPKLPLSTLVGHDKTVSYVKFVDSRNLVSASTDNTMKMWDLSMCDSQVLDRPVQSFTGHANVKNFVGLSVSDGYIATGSETNEVYIYHKAFPMPSLLHKFNTVDPLSGVEMDDSTQFVSSVCWRGQSTTLVAANSTGDIKILEMV
ncbi:hypothetical protein Droror1_Dr00015074 [Drosera rotundifolia]